MSATTTTPVHETLWHRDFWLLAMAELLLSVAVYMLIPTLPLWLEHVVGLDRTDIGLVMGIYGVGAFVLGPLCNWLVQHYRRNRVFLVTALLFTGVLAAFALVEDRNLHAASFSLLLLCAMRFVLGALFCLAQMVLSSTLIIDKCESNQRTAANHSASWFSRFALSLGPMAGLILLPATGFHDMVLVAALLACLSIVLVRTVSFPFKAPDDNVPLFSLDRCFLMRGKWLFVDYFLFSLALGLLLSRHLPAIYYGLLMTGFCIALLLCRKTESRSDSRAGIILASLSMALSMLFLVYGRRELSLLSPLLLGLGIGYVGSRFLLQFIRISLHCQRGTSQSTYCLAWESGLAIGIGCGLAFFTELSAGLLVLFLTLLAVATLFYVLFVSDDVNRLSTR
ncbi:MAG: MFS transporter [Prevotella sp.]